MKYNMNNSDDNENQLRGVMGGFEFERCSVCRSYILLYFEFNDSSDVIFLTVFFHTARVPV